MHYVVVKWLLWFIQQQVDEMVAMVFGVFLWMVIVFVSPDEGFDQRDHGSDVPGRMDDQHALQVLLQPGHTSWQ